MINYNENHDEAGRFAEGGGSNPQIHTPEFKAWFGDSKVVDKDGKPLVVYHGADGSEINVDHAAYGKDSSLTPDEAKKSLKVLTVLQDYKHQDEADPFVAQTIYHHGTERAKLESFIHEKTGLNVSVHQADSGSMYVQDEPRRYTETRGWGKRAVTEEKMANGSTLVRIGNHSGYLGKSYGEGMLIEDNPNSAWRGKTISEKATNQIGRIVSKYGDPTQIKSAIGNSGKFDPTKPSIIDSMKKLFNFLWGSIEVVNSADGPTQMAIYDMIGKDDFSGGGITDVDFSNALGAVNNMQDLHIHVNSKGGDVHHGMSMRNGLKAWKQKTGRKVTTIIDGIAASTASWAFPTASDEVKAYKGSQVFVHEAMALAAGSAENFRDTADILDKTSMQIADMYAEKSGKPASFWRNKMKSGSLMTGDEAKGEGLVDSIIDGNATNFGPWVETVKQQLVIQNKQISSAPTQGAENDKQNKTQIMNKTQMLALLNKWGVTPPADATDAQLIELVNAGPKAAVIPPVIPPAAENKVIGLSDEDKKTMADLRNQLSSARRKEITLEVQKHASEGRIPVNEIENWVNDAVAIQDNPTTGNSVLNRLAKLEPRVPGIAPVPMENHKLDVVNADIKDIKTGFQLHNESTKAFQRGLIDGEQAMKTIRNDAVAKAHFFRKFKNRFLEVMNTNTIDAGLQRQVILQDVVIRDFARRVLSLNLFSTVFRDVPLQGLHTVEVPYFDLDTSASQSFKNATGYNTLGNTTSGKREITIGQGPNDDGAFGLGHNRAYIGLQFSSQEIARQPYLKVAELAGLKAEKLAFDIFQDVLSVVSVANFGAAAITKAANQFDSDQIALLKLACKAWPEGGRGLMVDSAVDANLLQDPSFKFALNAASDLAIKEGRLFPRVMGFDYVENPNLSNLPNAGIANLLGFAVWKYAILVAFAPVPPVEEVRRAGTVWEMIIDPATGISLEYRQFGTNVTDLATNVIESSYGWAKGLGTALKPIVSA